MENKDKCLERDIVVVQTVKQLPDYKKLVVLAMMMGMELAEGVRREEQKKAQQTA